jgi:regulator of sirC expression with transglutaminase-like and TPR domain
VVRVDGARDRFVALVNGPEEELRLDEAALLIAAHAHPDLDVGAELARLDRLAAACRERTLDGWRHHVFDVLGFSGDSESYYDPDNSYLDTVIRRRKGIPITLSVVGIEIGRRLGLDLVGVGMPGHFLLRPADDPDLFVDPFAGGRLLDRQGCRERFRAVHPAGEHFSDSYLDPVGPRDVVARLLANLKSIFVESGDLGGLEWVMELRLAIPGMPVLERRDRARARAAAGRFRMAAEELEDLALVLPDMAEDLEAEAISLLARLN